MSLAVKDVPNVSNAHVFHHFMLLDVLIAQYLMYYGPHGPTGHGSGAPMIEARE